jgi:hypothetical protein
VEQEGGELGMNASEPGSELGKTANRFLYEPARWWGGWNCRHICDVPMDMVKTRLQNQKTGKKGEENEKRG